MTNPYHTRLVWPKGCTELDRQSAQSRAYAILRRLEEMELYKRSPSEIRRLAIHCRGLALVGGDRVTAERAAEILARVAPHKKYSLSERRAILAKARAKLQYKRPSHYAGKQYTLAEMRAINARARAMLARDNNRKLQHWNQPQTAAQRPSATPKLLTADEQRKFWAWYHKERRDT